jgi:hypothetical protein
MTKVCHLWDTGCVIGEFPNLTGSHVGLLFSAVTCTVAAWLSTVGAKRGITQHRIPRMLLASAVWVIAVSYWADLSHWFDGLQMRRGAGWLLWPSLAWTAWSGIRYMKKATMTADKKRRIMKDVK